VSHINLWESCYFAKVPDGPQTYTLDVLWLQEEGAQMHVCVKPRLHIHQECGPRFLPLLHTSCTVACLTALLGENVSSGLLCPVRSPVTALDHFLLKDRNLALTPRKGPEISSQGCLWVSPRPRKVRVNFTLEKAMNAQRGIRGTDLLVL
jgi:hypothetical protein